MIGKSLFSPLLLYSSGDTPKSCMICKTSCLPGCDKKMCHNFSTIKRQHLSLKEIYFDKILPVLEGLLEKFTIRIANMPQVAITIHEGYKSVQNIIPPL